MAERARNLIYLFYRMSKYLREPCYRNRQLENKWINVIFESHDLICGCNTPIDHLNHIIDEQRCPPSTAKDGEKTTGKAEEEPFTDGDLERLFAEDGEDATG
nr:MAG: hypothetical protein [Betatorquevirus sp.]